jgi:hypothetical protein
MRVGFEPKIPVLERANTVHALDRAATVIGCRNKLINLIRESARTDDVGGDCGKEEREVIQSLQNSGDNI